MRLRRSLLAVTLAPYLAVIYPLVALRRASFALRPGWSWRTWITPHLLVGGFLLPADVEELSQAGISAVINVSRELIDPRSTLAKAGIDYLRVPCWDGRVPSLQEADQGVRRIAAEIAAGRRVYVHCASGAGRSVTLALCYLAAHEGLTAEEGLARIKSLRPAAALRPGQRAFVDRFLEWRRSAAP